MNTPSQYNHLAAEKSPYLRQHATNPVDWYPWGDVAINRARAEEKPIFLSIGYSTCHWCHVMAHESFESEEVAALLNRHFVAIKVDREERPDIDRVYMSAVQAMGEHGGWPLSVFLTPGLAPFFGGTYFPPLTRDGRIGFAELLQRVAEIWMKERARVLDSANGILDYLRGLSAKPAQENFLDGGVIDRCYRQFLANFDDEFGGFGRAPKFPRPPALSFLLRYHYRTGEPEALRMVKVTLDAMAAGGIHDHLGGGFHRYAVDGEWRVPHFEKMLYDQAQLLELYTDMYRICKEPEYAVVARGIAEYVLRDLAHPEGALCSAENADSELRDKPGEFGEGAWYLWSKQEVIEALGPSLGTLFCLAYGIEGDGNAPLDPLGEFAGKNILYRAETDGDLVRLTGRGDVGREGEGEIVEELERGRARLLELRAARPRPTVDGKVIVAWNGLMISALAKAGAVFGVSEWIDRAARSARFMLEHMRDATTGQLLRRFCEGDANHPAGLEDYAALSGGLLDLYSSSGNPEWVVQATGLAEEMIQRFHDQEAGAFFDSAESSSVLVRTKEMADGAEPSGNSQAAHVLLRLGILTGRGEWSTIAEECVASAGRLLDKQPSAAPCLVTALDDILHPGKEIIVVGGWDEPNAVEFRKVVWSEFVPLASLVHLVPGWTLPIPPFARFYDLPQDDKHSRAHICEERRCSLPVYDATNFRDLLVANTQ